MASRPVTFGGYSFPSVSKAKAECRRIRDKYAVGEVVSDKSDDTFFRALVAEHRNRNEKVGKGIEHFEVARNNTLGARSGNLGIWIKQVGEAKLVDFGYGGVIEWIADPSNTRHDKRRVERALRNAIRSQTAQYLAEQLRHGGQLKSCISGKVLDPLQPIDVIHVHPRWGRLVDDFVVQNGGYSSVVTRQMTHAIGESLTDDYLKGSWIEFHQRHATLGLATPEENAQRMSDRG